mmetsp:Transcript_34729/g.51617  ORF Transcript_34729/g.51617 Transcript_34729/m.51617 type:complete len:98 (+) Transcript_34729:115-408(+)
MDADAFGAEDCRPTVPGLLVDTEESFGAGERIAAVPNVNPPGAGTPVCDVGATAFNANGFDFAMDVDGFAGAPNEKPELDEVAAPNENPSAPIEARA